MQYINCIFRAVARGLILLFLATLCWARSAKIEGSSIRFDQASGNTLVSSQSSGPHNDELLAEIKRQLHKKLQENVAAAFVFAQPFEMEQENQVDSFKPQNPTDPVPKDFGIVVSFDDSSYENNEISSPRCIRECGHRLQ